MAKRTVATKADKKLGGDAKAAAKLKKAGAVSVVGSDGEVIRTYSVTDHEGKDIVALANEFASKAEGRKVVVAEEVDAEEDVEDEDLDDEDEE